MIVLDSHVVLWLLAEPERVGPASTALLRESRMVGLSAASVWELGIKESLGKIRLPEDFLDQALEAGLQELPVTARHARLAAGTRTPQCDPFDRMLLAQAEAEGAVLLTADRAVLGLERADVRDARE